MLEIKGFVPVASKYCIPHVEQARRLDHRCTFQDHTHTYDTNSSYILKDSYIHKN